ncbi:MAG: hypothetical protein AAF402_07640 [Pseudomonadota bacterium]
MNIKKPLIVALMLTPINAFAQYENSLLTNLQQGKKSLTEKVDEVEVFKQPEAASGSLTSIVDGIQSLQQSASEASNQATVAIQNATVSLANPTGQTAPPPRSEGPRDPFALTPYIVEQFSASTSGEAVFTPTLSANVPPLALRGLVQKDANETVALLEIGNTGVYVVREGDTVGFRVGNEEQVMRIRKIDGLSVLVETGNLGKVIVVR